MFKLLLCWRYLRTRYIALASIVSVMLGVATMIVVNSVMDGFTYEMQNRIHGILSDVIFESVSVDGMYDADYHMAEIDRVAGQYIAGMSPTVHVPAMLRYDVNGHTFTRPINLIGIDEATYASVGDFGKYLQHPENREHLKFTLRDGGYDTLDHQAEDPDELIPRTQLKEAGWPHRRKMARLARMPSNRARPPANWGVAPAIEAAEAVPAESLTNDRLDPFAKRDANGPRQDFTDPAVHQNPGAVLGIALASVRNSAGEDRFLVLPGDDVRITFPMTSIDTRLEPEARTSIYTVVDIYESKMSEYDASFVFVPLRKLQEDRGMVHPQTGRANVTSIQIKLKPGADLDQVRDLLRNHFSVQFYSVSTWRDKQGALLAAVQMETMILNLLLFLIIAVAGFGILAIFFMIVFEKTRDIGVLKALGASRRGIMGIFLGYGLSLGVVGAGIGFMAGLAIVYYINEIADLLARLTGQPIFDPSVYYFQGIPTIVNAGTVAWIVLGATLIAVLASVLPARRAAGLHPVEALRYE